MTGETVRIDTRCSICARVRTDELDAAKALARAMRNRQGARLECGYDEAVL